MIIALDGPAGAGKSTVAQAVARELDFQYVDTGAIYRTLALMAHRKGVAWDDADALASLADSMTITFDMDGDVNRVFVAVADDTQVEVTREIRTVAISQGTSLVSSIPEVRAALLDMQRRLGAHNDCVLEGRDIGTVVFPNAEVKVFLTASAQERAQRRWKQWADAADDPDDVPSVETIADEIRKRDARDEEREIAPLKPAPDATHIDTTGLEFDEVVRRICHLAEVT